jgi:hypothetical protein
MFSMTLRSAIVGILLLTTGCGANGAKTDNTVCKSKTATELSASLKTGMSLADVVKSLELRKLEFKLETEEEKDSRKRGRSSNLEFNESNFLMTVVTDQKNSGLVRSMEFFHAGFGLTDVLEKTGCITLYTGPSG